MLSTLHRQKAKERINQHQIRKYMSQKHLEGVRKDFFERIKPSNKPKYIEIEEEFQQKETEFEQMKKDMFLTKRKKMHMSTTNVQDLQIKIDEDGNKIEDLAMAKL